MAKIAACVTSSFLIAFAISFSGEHGVNSLFQCFTYTFYARSSYDRHLKMFINQSSPQRKVQIIEKSE